MQPTLPVRLLLAVSGLVAATIGAAILFAPAAFHATHHIELGSDPSLLSEVRAPGAALLVLGLAMLTGIVRRESTRTSLVIAAIVYLSYGGARVLSLALDGVPDPGLVAAAVVEIAIGVACAGVLARASMPRVDRGPRPDGVGEAV